MGIDININDYLSHPDKRLVDHLGEVAMLSERFTSLPYERLVALFHDTGKVNPNFQAKLKKGVSEHYDHHAYLSSFVLLCWYIANPRSFETFNVSDYDHQNLLKALLVIVAKHHGDLPDFMPDSSRYVLSSEEIADMFEFIDRTPLPIDSLMRALVEVNPVEKYLRNDNIRNFFGDKLVFAKPNDYSTALSFFIEIQNAFACLIKSDKTSAGNKKYLIDRDKSQLEDFSKKYPYLLNQYLQKLHSVSPINVERTNIRIESISNLRKGLYASNRVFELTSPTGSGKTLMLLSLASEIIDQKGAKRIIYGLPYLSITEQVEEEALKIMKTSEQYVERIDSKSENPLFDKYQQELDENPSQSIYDKIEALEYQDDTFSYPFIITTFVRIFETLLSNRNHTLLKLPNFSNCIFLLDEIQALPPRLYSFFVAYLEKFCKLNNSYAVISTATQPNFNLQDENGNIAKFFSDYTIPYKLLSHTHFKNNVFNRYTLKISEGTIDTDELCSEILEENQSTLVILNTIDDTVKVYDKIRRLSTSDSIFLLNTLFTPRDRKLKLYMVKRRLRENKKVILISTQLIEAGVDIDFPVIYRDFAPVPNIVQSAGRCNRNGKIVGSGKVRIVRLKTDGKERHKLIYRGSDAELIRFTHESFQQTEYTEKELIQVQNAYFNKIQSMLCFGVYGKKLENNFIEDIRRCLYEKIGDFTLIDNDFYGDVFRYYIPRNMEDKHFDQLLQYQQELLTSLGGSNKEIVKSKKMKIRNILKKMSNRIVQVRLKPDHTKPLTLSDRDYYGLYEISPESYNFEKGVLLKTEGIYL